MAYEPPVPPAKFRFKAAEFERVNSPCSKDSPDSNSVYAHLRENLQHANDAGLNRVSLTPRRPSRRKRDYIIVMSLANIGLLAALLISPVFAAAGLVIFNVGFTWAIWGVMDDY